MEESKWGKLKLGTTKMIGRTNEKFKQRLGRSSESVITRDDKYQVIVSNFNRQQAAGFRLHREVKGYIASLKTLETSTQTLLDAIREMHEYQWPGNHDLVKALQGLEKLNKELGVAMVDTLLVPVNNYVEVFPQIKERLSKRERKLLDYTSSKRKVDTLKKGDKVSTEKLGFAQDQLTQHRMLYEEVNSEIGEDLPALWESRKCYMKTFLDSFFRQSVDFHKEFSQVYSECRKSLEPLKEQIQNEPEPLRKRDIGDTTRYFVVSDNARKFKRQSMRRSVRKSGGSFRRSLSMGALRKSKKDNQPQSMSNVSVDPYTIPVQQATPFTPTKPPVAVAVSSPPRPKPPRVIAENNAKLEPGGASPYSASISIEPGTEVECIHEYKAVDDDELSFQAGDIVRVVAWDSREEQDVGWFMGVLQGAGTKGAFPINYTRLHTTNDNIDKTPAKLDLSLSLSNGTASLKSPISPKTKPLRPPPPLSPQPHSPDIDSPSLHIDSPSLLATVTETPDLEVEVEGAEWDPLDLGGLVKVEPDQIAAETLETPAAVANEETQTEAQIQGLNKNRTLNKVSVDKVSVETPDVSVETPDVSLETPDVFFCGGLPASTSSKTPSAGLYDVSVETPDVEAETPDVEAETPEVEAELDVQFTKLDTEVQEPQLSDDVDCEVADVVKSLTFSGGSDSPDGLVKVEAGEVTEAETSVPAIEGGASLEGPEVETNVAGNVETGTKARINNFLFDPEDVDIEPEVEVEVETKVKAEPDLELEVETKVKAEPDLELEVKTEHDLEVHTEAHTPDVALEVPIQSPRSRVSFATPEVSSSTRIEARIEHESDTDTDTELTERASLELGLSSPVRMKSSSPSSSDSESDKAESLSDEENLKSFDTGVKKHLDFGAVEDVSGEVEVDFSLRVDPNLQLGVEAHKGDGDDGEGQLDHGGEKTNSSDSDEQISAL